MISKSSFNYCSPEVVKELQVVHYGSSCFDSTLFTPISNPHHSLSNWSKPIGGFWCSPQNSTFGWKDWCEASDYQIDNLSRSFQFQLHNNANIAVIDCLSHVRRLPLRGEINRFPKNIDWETLTQSCDAVWLTLRGYQFMRCIGEFDLSSWGCESIVILNSTIIKMNSR